MQIHNPLHEGEGIPKTQSPHDFIHEHLYQAKDFKTDFHYMKHSHRGKGSPRNPALVANSFLPTRNDAPAHVWLGVLTSQMGVLQSSRASNRQKTFVNYSHHLKTCNNYLYMIELSVWECVCALQNRNVYFFFHFKESQRRMLNTDVCHPFTYHLLVSSLHKSRRYGLLLLPFYTEGNEVPGG